MWLGGIFDGEEGEVFLIVVLNGVGDGGGVGVKGRKPFQIADDLSEFTVGCAFDDVLLYLFLLFSHLINQYNPINLHTLNHSKHLRLNPLAAISKALTYQGYPKLI